MSPAELRALARDRPLVTSELHPFNAFYGHAAILKAYAGLPPDRPLKVLIEHGFSTHDAIPELEHRPRLPVYLCQSERRARLADKAGARGLAIGPLILYADALATPRPARERTRLLLFPAHSAHFSRVRYDVARFLRSIEEFAAGFDELQVCLYWRDVLLGMAEPYEALGLPVVTAGHIFDPSFLCRLRDILAAADAIATNEVGTHIPYAVALGRTAYLVEQETVTENEPWIAPDSLAIYEREQGDPPPLLREARRVFAEPTRVVTATQREFVERSAGMRLVRTPPELRNLLLDAEATYRSSTGSLERLEILLRARLRHARGLVRTRLASP